METVNGVGVNGFGFPAKTHYRNRNTSEADQKLASLRPSETVIDMLVFSSWQSSSQLGFAHVT